MIRRPARSRRSRSSAASDVYKRQVLFDVPKRRLYVPLPQRGLHTLRSMRLHRLVRLRPRLLSGLVIFLGFCPANASQIAVQVRLQGGPPSHGVPVSLTATPGDGRHALVKREVAFSTAAPASVPFDLSDETDWIVTAHAAGYWSA